MASPQLLTALSTEYICYVCRQIILQVCREQWRWDAEEEMKNFNISRLEKLSVLLCWVPQSAVFLFVSSAHRWKIAMTRVEEKMELKLNMVKLFQCINYPVKVPFQLNNMPFVDSTPGELMAPCTFQLGDCVWDTHKNGKNLSDESRSNFFSIISSRFCRAETFLNRTKQNIFIAARKNQLTQRNLSLNFLFTCTAMLTLMRLLI